MDDLTLDLRPQPLADGNVPESVPFPKLRRYTLEQQQKQRDWVRMIVTIAVLSIFAWVIVWASIESQS